MWTKLQSNTAFTSHITGCQVHAVEKPLIADWSPMYNLCILILSFNLRFVCQFQEVVHFAPDYDNGQLLRLLIEIYDGVPESYELFHCNKDSTEDDLKLFLQRASTFK